MSLGSRLGPEPLAQHDDRGAEREARRGAGEPVSLLNLPSEDPAAAAFRALGGAVVVRQHEMLLELAPP